MDKLNKFQKNVVSTISNILKNNDKALIHMATGTGKTETAIKLIKEREYNKVLWITHQTDLVEQTAERFITNELYDVGEFSALQKSLECQITIATIQTLGRDKHLNNINKNKFDAIFVDEAHHAAAQQWSKTIKHFNADKIGLTATPYRPDGLISTNSNTGVFDLFGEPQIKLSFNDAIKMGFLAKPISRVILTTSALDGFKTDTREYSVKQLDKLYSSKSRNFIILKEYKAVRSKLKKPKAVGFCININHARNMAKLFSVNGIKANFICSNSKFQTPQERNNVMTKFRETDEIEVLFAVNIFNEGIDIPEANIALMIRPTGSNIVYQQQIGRVARTNGGKKKEFYVLDFVDNTRKEFNGFVLSNLVKPGNVKNQTFITEYIENPNEKDEVNARVRNIMARAKKFEDEQYREYQKRIKNITEDDLDFLEKTGKLPEHCYE